MCGISGVMRYNKNYNIKILADINNAMRLRGPDDEGYVLFQENQNTYKIFSGNDTVKEYKYMYPFIKENDVSNYDIGFAHRRLSILDLTAHGHQPMCNEDGTIWITFNGEVYNYKELREQLIKLGHSFKSNTDTEVIIHAYEEWKEDSLRRFNGMWSFAIYDMNTKSLFCSRDRFGVKPFYYYQDKDKFVFASEIKAIIQDKTIKRKVNDDIAFDFIKRGFLDHTSETFFENIYQLPQSSYMIVKDGKITINKYYEINKQICNNSFDEIKNDFLKYFKDSVNLRLRSDVELGSALSGGLDSSAIVSMIDKIFKENDITQRPNTFSSVFDNKKYDEQEYIDEINDKMNCIAHKISPDPEKLIDDIKHLIYIQDEPFSSLSIYAQYNVMKLVSKTDVKVLLDGQGSDEILAGYHDAYIYYLADLIHTFKFSLFKSEINAREKYLGVPKRKSICEVIYYFLSNRIKGYLKGRHFRDKRVFKDNLKNGLYYMFFKYNLPSYLHYEDRNSMAFSIESRVPFLDYRLVDFAFSLNGEYKISNGNTKYILREALRGILPEKIRDRKDKMGFVTPQEIWQQSELKPFIDNVVNSRSFKERKYFKNININKENCYTIWRCVNMELWLQQFIDN